MANLRILVDVSDGIANGYNYIIYKGIKYIDVSHVKKIEKEKDDLEGELEHQKMLDWESFDRGEE